jgi:hypothetical protein
MERLVDVDAITRMLVEYLRLDPADRPGYVGGSYAAETWGMLAEAMSIEPEGAGFIQAVEKDPLGMHTNLVSRLKVWAYHNPGAANRLAELLDGYNQARSNISVSRGEITTEEKTINIKQTGSVDIDVTEVDLDSLLPGDY